MVFDQELMLKSWWDNEWLIPKFNDPRLLGDDNVNECDLFMLLRDYSDREKIGYLERSVENICNVEASVKSLIVKRGPSDHLLKSEDLISKLKILMEKRMRYIDKLIPEKKD
jgi:hypothetical protein